VELEPDESLGILDVDSADDWKAASPLGFTIAGFLNILDRI